MTEAKPILYSGHLSNLSTVLSDSLINFANSRLINQQKTKSTETAMEYEY